MPQRQPAGNRRGRERMVIYSMTQYRHEWKHEINFSDGIAVRQRLRAVARPDIHTEDGRYAVRSLYFDTPGDKALREKLDGVNLREKFRIRYYNWDTSLIRLEKKVKRSGLGTKLSAELTAEEARAAAEGEWGWMPGSGKPLVQELYSKMKSQGLGAKTIVDYVREPYVYEPGNVRVTLDSDIRTGMGGTDFLNPACATVPVPGAPVILEVKWDAFLPGVIRDAVQLPGRRAAAFSKYAACRLFFF